MDKTITLKVAGMSCNHCVQTVTKAVSALPGVADVRVDLAAGEVACTVTDDQTTREQVAEAIDEVGFDVKGE